MTEIEKYVGLSEAARDLVAAARLMNPHAPREHVEVVCSVAIETELDDTAEAA